MLCFYCTQTHMKLQSEFSREFKKKQFSPVCRPLQVPPGAARTPSLRQCAKFLYYAWICTRHFVATIKSGVLFPPRERRPFIQVVGSSHSHKTATCSSNPTSVASCGIRTMAQKNQEALAVLIQKLPQII